MKHQKQHALLPLSPVTRTTLIVLLVSMLLLGGIFWGSLIINSFVAIDASLANLFFAARTTQGLMFFYGVSFLGEAWIVLIAAGVLSCTLFLHKQKLLALGVWLSIVPGEGITYLSKLFFHRERPILAAVAEDSFSFPSNHATIAILFYGFLTYLLLKKVTSWYARLAILLGSLLLIILIDTSRLYLGVHYLSDILAGNLVGLASLLFAIFSMEWICRRTSAIHWNRFSLTVILPSLFCLLGIVLFLCLRTPLLFS
ncbi:TPA: hypothetical protein DEB00_01845 [Candidatus Uhrbacteria bacterium]|nr:hypothetical protein [Candidatus Uhrbacteria bacterium]